MKKTLLFLIFACFTAINLLSQETSEKKESPIKLKFLLGGALEFGGDSVAEILFEDGSDQSVNAGQGGTIFAGGELFLLSKLTFHYEVVLVLNM